MIFYGFNMSIYYRILFYVPMVRDLQNLFSERCFESY